MTDDPYSSSDRSAGAHSLAERIRASRSEVVAALGSSSIGIREVLESSDPLIGCIKVVAVVESLPGLGKVKARRILASMDIEGHRRIRDLDDRDKQLLVEQVTQ